MSQEELRKEAVRRRLAGESPLEIGDASGRSSRWVREWFARHEEDGLDKSWTHGRSRAPHHSPTQTAAEVAELIVAARKALVANPRAQYGALAVQWELRRLGLTDIPRARTIERVLG